MADSRPPQYGKILDYGNGMTVERDRPDPVTAPVNVVLTAEDFMDSPRRDEGDKEQPAGRLTQ